MILLVDLITRIRNASLVSKEELKAPFSNMSRGLLSVLLREGFISGFSEDADGPKGYFVIKLKPNYQNRQVITEIKSISVPGRKVYVTCKDLIKMRAKYSGIAVYVVSTSSGVLADHEAIASNVGGKLICKVM